MILSISQYIEAITNCDGRLKTLEQPYVVRDEAGEPVFIMPGHGLVDFELAVGEKGVRHTLRCPLRYDTESILRLRALSEREGGLGSRFFTPWRLLEKELVLFDVEGTAVEVDVLARVSPVGEPLADFLQRAVARGDRESEEAIYEVRHSFGELCDWADDTGQNGIVMRRLLVEADGTLLATGFSANDEREHIFEILQAAAAGKHLPTVATEAENVGIVEKADGNGEIRCVRDGGGWMYVDRRGRYVIDTVWKSASPFREKRAVVETRTGKGLIDTTGRAVVEPVYEEVAWDDYWGIAAVMIEGRWSLVDRDGLLLTTEPYEWLGECSEGMVLAVRNDKCGFVNLEEREVISCTYDDASSFSEGCAIVSLDKENFFIDARGSRI